MNDAELKLEQRALVEFIKLIDVGGSLGRRAMKVVDEELTQRQKQMVQLYYIRQMNMPEIALELGVSPSCVSRTISRGRQRITKYLKYNGRAFSGAEDDWIQ